MIAGISWMLERYYVEPLDCSPIRDRAELRIFMLHEIAFYACVFWLVYINVDIFSKAVCESL